MDDYWQIWVDTGGTFTDGIGVSPSGDVRRVKILSTSALRGRVSRQTAPDRVELTASWDVAEGLLQGLTFRLLGDDGAPVAIREHEAGPALTLAASAQIVPGSACEIQSPEEAPLFAARLLTETALGDPLPPARFRLATTLGTNALLERRGAPTALFITRGFADLLSIGTQQRRDLFRLDAEPESQLYDAVIEVDERLDSNGAVIRELQIGALRRQVDELVDRGIDSAAVALLHAYRNPAHERELSRLLQEWGFHHVSCSSELAPRIKLLPRAHTAVVDAYLARLVKTYLDQVGRPLPRGDLLVMTSAGGLLDRESYRAKDCLLSGPAGGVVGAASAGRRAGFGELISFDMGGTSTDTARIHGDYEYRFSHRVGAAEVLAPALAIETVAAGGGSICWLDGERVRVGPQSAGARPGPACYGAGGPLTITDVNLLLGRLRPERFVIPIDPAPARRRLAELLTALRRRTGEGADEEALLHGLLAVANETMADAIRRISLRRGHDPAEHTLVAFGGAGGQHACSVAELLGVQRVVLPPDAALLSALGLGEAVVERFRERQVLRALDEVGSKIGEWIEILAGEAVQAVTATGTPRSEIEVRRRSLRLRFAGQESTLEVEWRPGLDVRSAFEERHIELYGHRPEQREVELESIGVFASSRGGADPGDEAVPRSFDAVPAHGSGPFALFDRAGLAPGAAFSGPGLVLESHSATVVEEGWTGKVGADGALLLLREQGGRRGTDRGRPESVRLELFTQRFTGLVREMGERLERTAVSTNVKERLDFSCALLDPRGELVVNAPHIPVHLGALGECVRRLRDSLEMRPGDVIVTNHPAFGGSHLPDVTVVTPAFADPEGGCLLGYLASRAHHAEIGGIRPGSMPPTATRLVEEGVVIPPIHGIDAGRPNWDAVRELLVGSPYPSRAVEDNLADLRAAAAANHAGVVGLHALTRQHGVETVLEYMEKLERLADQRIREALQQLGDGVFEAEECLDDDSRLRVRIEVRSGRARIDFHGSADVHPGNLNATPAIVRSAVIYVMRLLLREPLPLNEGLLRAVSIDLPPGMLNPLFSPDPETCPAVVGGNVETSQRLVDTLIKALGLAACSQGTMNNLIFGNERYGYYETLGGGCGAGPGFDGPSAVHSHMTNTRITDPEILEHRFPVRVERFEVRRGSGGSGRFRGGDGLIRELRFLEAAELSLLTQHRRVAPYGMAGGAPGKVGAQRIVRSNGEIVPLDSIDGCRVEAGDRLIVETPGGGGHGAED